MTIIINEAHTVHNEAEILLEAHGWNAEQLALDTMMTMIEKNDIPGAGHWLSVANVIEELRLNSKLSVLH